MLEFKKYEATASLTDLGTVAQNKGNKGTVQLIGKNLQNAAKRVAVIITNAKGESATVSCSKAVSDALRAKTLAVGQLMGLHILENEEGVPFISMPAGEGSLIDISGAKQAEYVAPKIENHNELVAW